MGLARGAAAAAVAAVGVAVAVAAAVVAAVSALQMVAMVPVAAVAARRPRQQMWSTSPRQTTKLTKRRSRHRHLLKSNSPSTPRLPPK